MNKHPEEQFNHTLLQIQRDLAIALGAATQVGQMATIVLQHICRVPGIDAVGYYQLDWQAQEIRLIAHRGISDTFITNSSVYPFGSPQGQTVLEGRPLFISRHNCHPAIAANLDIERFLQLAILPIRLNDRTVGVLNVASRSVHTFPDPVKAGLEATSGQLSSIVARIEAQDTLRVLHQMLEIKFERASKDLIQSEQRLREIVERAPAGLHHWELNPEGTLVFAGANPAADKILGVDNKQFIGKTMPEAFPNLGPEIEAAYRKVIETGQSWTTDLISYQDEHIQGAFHILAFATSPRGMSVMFLDVTEQKRLAAERERINENLAQTQKFESLGVMASGIAHDFNNILMGVIGSAELMREELSSNASVVSFADGVLAAAQRLRDLTRQIQSYAGQAPQTTEAADLSHLVRDTLPLVKLSRGPLVEISDDLSPDLPMIGVDSSLVRQAIMNLLLNAIDAALQPPRQKAPRVAISTRKETLKEGFPSALHVHGEPFSGLALVIEVFDSGGHLTGDIARRVFDPFFSTKAKGRGLGMAVVSGAVRGHRGFLTIDSSPTKGTFMRLHLPLRAPAPESPSPGDSGLLESPRNFVGRALLVDDDPSVLEMMTRLSRAIGLTPVGVDSGEAALKLLETDPHWLVVIMDQTMPGLSGTDTLRRLRENHPDLPVLLVSGQSDAALDEMTFGGPTLFLPKPFTLRQLRHSLSSLLQRNG